MNRNSLTLPQKYHGTQWQQTCSKPRTLLIVDYYSRFPVLCKLGSTTSKVLVQEMKAVFAELEVPNIIVSDGGPQYTSAEFKDFMKHWQIEHTILSPRNPESNDMAEHCVQTMKASLIKTIEEGEDVNLALLTYKTTPLNHRLPSPAELLNSRKYKTLLPTHIVPTRLQESYRQIMNQGKHIQAQLYKKNARVLPRLQQSQKVVSSIYHHHIEHCFTFSCCKCALFIQS